jgi:hypothetical protein
MSSRRRVAIASGSPCGRASTREKRPVSLRLQGRRKRALDRTPHARAWRAREELPTGERAAPRYKFLNLQPGSSHRRRLLVGDRHDDRRVRRCVTRDHGGTAHCRRADVRRYRLHWNVSCRTSSADSVLHPQMLRHSAITQAVETSGRDGLSLDKVDFSRHKNIGTT